MPDEPNPCPLCGALPCDWVDNPHNMEVGLCWTLAKIREVLGVGCKPMMDELPDILATTLAAQQARIDALERALEESRTFTSTLAMYDGSAPTAGRFVSIPAIAARRAKACLPTIDAALQEPTS